MHHTTACLFASRLIMPSLVAAAQAQARAPAGSFLSRWFVVACACKTPRGATAEHSGESFHLEEHAISDFRGEPL
jgi:hypothetical protein